MLRLGPLAAFAVPLACAGSALAANLPADLPSWAIAPDEASCHTDLELTARSGAVTPVTLVSDGERVVLRFAMETVPERAFLPIRVDQKAYANLVLRGEAPGLAMMTLSEETLTALRKGKTLQIAWLSDEAAHGALAGAAQGLADLKLCGAQVSSRWRSQQQAQAADRARTESDARARAVADEQLAVVRAQRAAAEAEGRRQAAEAQRITAEAQRARAESEALAAQAEQNRAYAEQARQRAQMESYPAQYYDDRRYQSEDELAGPSPYAYRRYYPR